MEKIQLTHYSHGAGCGCKISPKLLENILQSTRETIEYPEPIFGLAVTGLAENKNIRRNATAETGCSLFLTKPHGIGILTTAQKQAKIAEDEINVA